MEYDKHMFRKLIMTLNRNQLNVQIRRIFHETELVTQLIHLQAIRAYS